MKKYRATYTLHDNGTYVLFSDEDIDEGESLQEAAQRLIADDVRENVAGILEDLAVIE